MTQWRFSLLALSVMTILLIGAGIASASWTGLGGGPRRDNDHGVDLSTPLGIEWKVEGNGDLRDPIWADETVYVASSNKRVYAVDLETGEVDWSNNINDRIYDPLEFTDGNLYVLAEGVIRNFTLEDGNDTMVEVPGTPTTTPLIWRSFLIVCNETDLMAFKEGVMEWNVSLAEAPEAISASLDHLYILTENNLKEIDPLGGFKDGYTTAGEGAPAISGDNIFVMHPARLERFETGLINRTTLHFGFTAQDFAIGDMIIVTTSNSVKAYYRNNLTLAWTTDTNELITTKPLLLDNSVAVGTKFGLQVFELNGTLRERHNLSDKLLGCLAPFEGGILAGSTDNYLYKLSKDTDEDGVADATDAFDDDPTQWSDQDGDGYGDNPDGSNPDAFPTVPSQWNDTDEDGYGDNPNGTNPDRFPLEPTQWNDTDSDGYGDNPEGNDPDAFPFEPTQWIDSDGDGYGDNPNGTDPDALPSNPTQWNDTDGDGYGDRKLGDPPDLFPNNADQWSDADGDGYGDNPDGLNGDALPSNPTQWMDADGDGWGDNPNGTFPDALPSDSTQWNDTDGDGHGDNQNGFEPDRFPIDHTQWSDVDGDGYGDNSTGTYPDEFPLDATQWKDSDGDGHGDNPNGTSGDALPSNPTQWQDSDGDGYGDDPNGTEADEFPNDKTEWKDSDLDGIGDNADANPFDRDNDGTEDSVDDFPDDPSQWRDSDGDGYGDRKTGNMSDAFPNDPKEWMDSDGDGRGDNSDKFKFDRDNDGHADSVDDFPDDRSQYSDRDEDGYGDNDTGLNPDAFPLDGTQWSDKDGDGYGDNPDGKRPDEFPDDPDEWRDSDNDGLGDNSDFIPWHNTLFAYFVIVFLIVFIPLVSIIYLRHTRDYKKKRIRKGIGEVSGSAEGLMDKREKTRVKSYIREADKAVSSGDLDRADAFLAKGRAETYKATHMDEMCNKYRSHLAHLVNVMRRKGIPAETASTYLKECREGQIETKVEKLMAGVEVAQQAISSHTVGSMLAEEMKLASRELADRGYRTGTLSSEVDMATKAVSAGDYRSAFKLLIPVLEPIRRLKRLPRGSEKDPGEVERIVSTRDTLASGDMEASRELFLQSLKGKKVETWDDLIVVDDKDRWAILLTSAGKATTPDDMEDATINLAVHRLKRVHLFSGVGFTPDAMEKAKTLRIIHPLGLKEAMGLIFR